MKVLRASAVEEVAGDHSSLAAEPEIEVTSAEEPSIPLPPSPHAIDDISLKRDRWLFIPQKRGEREGWGGEGREGGE